MKRTMISIPEAKEVLETIDVEKVDQIQKRALDYTSKFSKTTPQRAKTLRKKLMKECSLTDQEATELIDVMPKSIEELRVFTTGWKKLLPTEVVEKALEILRGGPE